MKTYKIHLSNSVGCESTMAEGARVETYLKLNGHRLVDDPASADFIVVNTCAFLKVHRERVLKRIRDFNAVAPKARIVVMGCVRDISPRLLDGIPIEMACGHFDINKLDAFFSRKISFESSPSHAFHSSLKKTVVVICRGCSGHCTFCTINRSTGGVKSMTPDRILEVAGEAAANGKHDFIFTGDDVGCYGHDIGLTLPMLLNAAKEGFEGSKIMLGNINPKWFNLYIDELVNFILHPVATQWLFLSVQSASDSVIKAMGRDYSIDETIRNINRLSAVAPVKFYYDIMCGFPGETETDFKKTLDFIMKYPPSAGMIAAYSPEEGTPAFGMKPHPPEVLNDRMKRLKTVWGAAQYLLEQSRPGMVGKWGT
ncbi:MAG: radical SAM protein [Myxococcota bacterium]|jgi:MiaB/RimO family radical SAM methylthiotransferase